MVERIYETDQLVVCVKPQGLPSQDEPGGRSLPALLRAELGGEIYPVHRLDRAAGGVMVFARTREAAAFLSEAIRAGRMEKTYLAVLKGCPQQPSGRLEDLLYHDPRRNKTYVVQRLRRGVRTAALEYETLAETADAALVRIRLLTGRTHQIRVQFASRGMPLLGDRTYGGGKGRLALWCRSLTIPLPDGSRRTFTREPPDEPPWSGFSAAAPVAADEPPEG